MATFYHLRDIIPSSTWSISPLEQALSRGLRLSPCDDEEELPPFYQFKIAACNLTRMEILVSEDPELMLNLTTVKLEQVLPGWEKTDLVICMSFYERYRGMDHSVGPTSITSPKVELSRKSEYGLDYILFVVNGIHYDTRSFLQRRALLITDSPGNSYLPGDYFFKYD